MPWHYLTVYRDHGEERHFSLCEVYLDDQGKLDFWVPNPEMSPGGEDITSLTRTLGLMLLDAQAWEPVRFDDLKVGLRLQPRLSQAERQRLKGLIEQFGQAGA